MMKHIPVSVLYLLSAFYISCTQSQTKVNNYNTITENKDSVSTYGPNRMVRNVRQDKKGNILIAAYNGVLRYNGKTFTNITVKINSPSFWDVLEDRKGNLWLSTRDSGVYRYNGKSFQHFTTKDGLIHNTVTNIYEDRAGNIWFGTGGGASRYDGKSFQNFTKKDGLPHNEITTILEDKTGRFWFGSSGEACFYDGKAFTVFKNKEGHAFNNVRSIIEDKKGNIWFGASIIERKLGDTVFVSAGLWRYDGSNFIKVTNSGASAIIEDKKGNVLTTGAVNPNGVGAWKLSRYDRKSLDNKKAIATEIMSVNKMLCGILEANDGSIWFGSINGVYRYDGKTITDFKRVAIGR